MDRDLPTPGLLPKCLQKLAMGQTEPGAQSSAWISHKGGRDTSTWAITAVSRGRHEHEPEPGRGARTQA